MREPKAGGNLRSSLSRMMLVALALRLVVMSFLYPERTDPARDHWRFGGESVFWSFNPRYLEKEPADPFNMIFCTGSRS